MSWSSANWQKIFKSAAWIVLMLAVFGAVIGLGYWLYNDHGSTPNCVLEAASLDALVPCEIKGHLEHLEKIERVDFIFDQMFTWLGIISSLVAAIVAASGVATEARGKLIVAGLAALPAALIAVNVNINFAERCRWDRGYINEILKIRRELSEDKNNVKAIAKELTDIELARDKSFPGNTHGDSNGKSVGSNGGDTDTRRDSNSPNTAQNTPKAQGAKKGASVTARR